MVRLTKITTRGGDKGMTSLGSGERVSKDAMRIHAIGDVDEANAYIGFVIQYVTKDIAGCLKKIQNDLFDLGADLCMPAGEGGLRVTTHQVETLDQWINEYNSHLLPLNSFVLPGGTMAASTLHIARTVTRRAERSVVALNAIESINENIIRYLNRLSDLLFVLSRFVNLQNGDVLWTPGENH